MGVYDSKRKIYCKDTKECVTARDYLKSEHWRRMRKHIYEKYKGKCKKCGRAFSSEHMNVHHLTYKRIGNEKDSDLTLLCETCHQLLHATRNKNRKPKQSNQITKKELSNEDMKIYEIYLTLKYTDLDHLAISKKFGVSTYIIKQIAAKKGKYGVIIRLKEKDSI